ncbi:MAG: hypothetical protein EA425_06535 [Puniceicoccaceae bacterium]|nr:MAG: hypothetical protein EA425_06535 [Puniceicoccaceae bacterium]
MKSRLEKLLEQRKLLEDHLAWIDAEIQRAREEKTETNGSSRGKGTPAHPPPDEPPSRIPAIGQLPPGPAAATAPATAAIGDPATLPEKFRPDSKSLARDVRFGCLLYGGIATMLLAGLVALIYLIYD